MNKMRALNRWWDCIAIAICATLLPGCRNEPGDVSQVTENVAYSDDRATPEAEDLGDSNDSSITQAELLKAFCTALVGEEDGEVALRQLATLEVPKTLPLIPLPNSLQQLAEESQNEESKKGRLDLYVPIQVPIVDEKIPAKFSGRFHKTIVGSGFIKLEIEKSERNYRPAFYGPYRVEGFEKRMSSFPLSTPPTK